MMYQDTTVTGMSKEGSDVRRDAAELKKLKQAQREQEVYDLGNQDAYTAVEQAMMRKAEQQRMEEMERQAYNNFYKQPVETAQPSLYDRAAKGLSDFFTKPAKAPANVYVPPIAQEERMREEQRINRAAQEADRKAQGYK